jgi:hypothetical protein
MITRRALAGLVLGVVALAALSGCGPREPDIIFRYKMTVEIQTPDGIKSGSSVRELVSRANDSWFPFGESRPSTDLQGEAVAVDLPEGKTIFALLTGPDGDVDYAARIAVRSGLWSIQKPWPPAKTMELWPDAPDTQKLERNSAIPMLVTFKEIADPTSVQRVDPYDLAASFGAGYRLKAITVQVTDEAVTVGIQKRLGWLNTHSGSLDYSGRLHPQNQEKDLTQRAFKQGRI